MLIRTPSIGIDIGSSAIKIVELSGNSPKKLRSIGIELIPPGAIADGFIQDTSAVEISLKNLIKKLNLRTRGRRAALSLGGSSVIIKKVYFPNKSEEELIDLIEAEAEQHFQHDLNDLYFSWNTLDAPSKSEEVPIVLVGVKKELLEQHISVIKTANMKIGITDCDVFSLSNMFQYNFGSVNGLTVISNVGASSTQVSIINNGNYLYYRDIPIAGNHYTQALETSLNIGYENAESLKIDASGSSPSSKQVGEIINVINDQLVQEILATIDFFFQNGEAPLDASSIDRIFLTGGGSRTLGLSAAIAASLQVPVQILNPFYKIEIPKKFDRNNILFHGPIYGIGVGLSLRELDEST